MSMDEGERDAFRKRMREALDALENLNGDSDAKSAGKPVSKRPRPQPRY